METSAVIACVNKKYHDYLKDGADESFEETLDKIALGTRNGSTAFQAVNILTSIDKLDLDFPKIREIYDNLSEYAHPNSNGTFGSYLKKRGGELGFEVNSFGSALEKDLKPAITISLAVAVYFRQRIHEAL